jgi:hypothetical protein
MTLRTKLAYAAAGLALVLGLLSLFNPFAAMRLFGLEMGAPRGLAEIRSMYGALYLTMAALMLWAVPLRPRTAPLLRTLGVLWLGVAGGRVASLLIDGLFGPINLLLLAVQLFIGGALAWASLETTESRRAARVRLEVARDRRKAEERAAAARAAASPGPAGAPASTGVPGPATTPASGAGAPPPAPAGHGAPSSPAPGGPQRDLDPAAGAAPERGSVRDRS